ncbi:MAG: ABC transporter ATP-binding protein [Thermoleophilaceae bacterium]|nr:ABC transporter ATP-binding protein [Thermoleophilaceae bacterium]
MADQHRQAAVVEFDHVTKRYDAPTGRDKGKPTPGAVNDLSMKVPAGKICILVGPSGCGKTTTMKMINRIIEPTSGTIRLQGEDVTGSPPDELRRRIGYVIQQVGLFPHLTIADNVATVPRLLRWDGSRTRARVDEMLDLVGMDPSIYRGRYPKELSGGQRQRVGVARALAADPPVMLMDEPFGAVDPIAREKLQNEFLRLQEDIGKTIVFVTHDIDEAIKMGDRIAVLRTGGKLAQYASPAELLMYPADEFVEDFVGADRALKRLALQRVRDIDLWTAATVRSGEPVAEARRKIAEADIDIPLVVDDHGRPQGWLSERGLAGERVRPELRSRAEPLVELDDVLRDALADLIESEVHYSPVVDPDGCLAGVLSLEVISQSLHVPPERARTSTELVEPAGDDAVSAEIEPA